jgi:hypothetical protein
MLLDSSRDPSASDFPLFLFLKTDRFLESYQRATTEIVKWMEESFPERYILA